MNRYVFKFVSWDATPEEIIKETRYYKLIEKLENGEKLTRLEKDSIHSLNGVVKQGGWMFDFRPFMKTYLVKDECYKWRELYAFDKTSLRNNYDGCKSHILRIVELED